MQEIGKSYYFKGDYKSAYRYYKRFNAMQKMFKVDIFRGESLKMGIVWDKLGMKEEAKEYFRIYKEYAFNDKSVYRDLSLMAYYAWLGDQQKALDHMKLFSKENDYQYWILFMADEPLFNSFSNRPEFKEAMATIEKKFWDNHKKIRAMLEEKGLL